MPMNLQVRLLDLEAGDRRTYTLVFTRDTYINQNKIPVLASIGTAMLGFRDGDAIEWRVLAGVKRVRIEDSHSQPEAPGHYDL